MGNEGRGGEGKIKIAERGRENKRKGVEGILERNQKGRKRTLKKG